VEKTRGGLILIMCKVITPESTEGHLHVHGPLEEAELLRETIAEELEGMTSLVARWHAVEGHEAKHAFLHAIESKKANLKNLWEALEKLEESLFSEAEHEHSHHHHH
jgi:hypothetical protein